MSSFEVAEAIQSLQSVPITDAVKRRIINLIDLTSLNATDTEVSMATFCKKAKTPLGLVAAICVYPQFVRLMATEFADTSIKIATVANFPQGTESLEEVLAEINRALTDGAQEIDVVFPYTRYLSGNKSYAREFIAACKAACGENITLKVIIESGALHDLAIIKEVSKEVIIAGANFVKTSTGKIAQGASLEAAAASQGSAWRAAYAGLGQVRRGLRERSLLRSRG